MPDGASDPPLAAGFGDSTEADWRAAAEQALKGQPVAELDSITADGIRVRPVYPLTHPGATIPGRPPETRWQIVQRIDAVDPAEAIRQAEADITGGADGLDLVFASAGADGGAGIEASPTEFLDRLGRPAAALRVEAGPPSPALIETARGRLGEVTLCIDAASALARAGGGGDASRFSGWLAAVPEGAPNLSFCVVDGRVWHEAGATEAGELAAALAALVAFLRAAEGAGRSPAWAVGVASVTLTTTSDLFLSVAKLRAWRLLNARLLAVTGLPAGASRLHAETARPMLVAGEAEQNLLRAGTAAFAAGVGGADSVTVLPMQRPADDFARRLARNISLILMGEAKLHRAPDPGAGAGAIETLTDQLARRAWDLFRRIERDGGIAALAASGGWRGLLAPAAAPGPGPDLARRPAEVAR